VATVAYQDLDIDRRVLSGGALANANGSPKAWVGGIGIGAAHPVALDGGFTLTPRANLGWQHLAREGYTESGGGLAAVSIDDMEADAVRGEVGADLSLNIHDPYASWTIRPRLSAALARDWRLGDDTASGTFSTSGAGFTAALDTRDQTYLAVGAGVDMSLGNGVTAFASYEGSVGGDVETRGGVRLGARIEW
jgi:fibronectin-binding autotransporter adhesin